MQRERSLAQLSCLSAISLGRSLLWAMRNDRRDSARASTYTLKATQLL